MVLYDIESWCCTSTDRDRKTIASRIEHEGLSFLTITLPNFGRDLQKALDQGFVSDELFLGFSRDSAGLPRFLGGFLQSVFDSNLRLLNVPDITSIWAIRQLTLMFAKMSLPCTDVRNRDAMSKYVECEKDVRIADELLSQEDYDSFRRIGVLLWSEMLTAVDKDIYDGAIIPKHGPGSTADRLTGNSKWGQLTWTRRLEEVFPNEEYLTSSDKISYELLPPVDILEPGAEVPVRVITVPKTLKTPRIIAIEPTCMQFMQQAVLGSIVKHVQRVDIPRTFISWQSQDENRELARIGSRDQTLATLDLSEASDRVSNQHVRALLMNHPHLLSAVDACRSRKADVPGFGVLRLAKFASMGSALCFPFESMVFCTLIFMGIQNALNRPITRKDIIALSGKVRVYGDDIIVPVEYVHSVTATLETFGFRVNNSKSFGSGKFRESCGKDYYDGVDVSITRLRSSIPSSRKDVAEVVSSIATRNLLYKAGMWRSVKFLDNVLLRFIPMPYVLETSPSLGRYSFLGLEPTERNHSTLFFPLIRGSKVVAASPDSHLEGYPALLKCLTLMSLRDMNHNDLPVVGADHLERSGRPRVVNIKRGWLCPF